MPRSPGHASRRQMAQPDDLRIFGRRFLQTANVFLGNYQHVRRRLGIDVLKRESVLVFKTFLAGISPAMMRQNRQSFMAVLSKQAVSDLRTIEDFRDLRQTLHRKGR